MAELLDLAVLVHTQTTCGWLYIVGAPLDLRREAATLALRAAEDLDDPIALGVAAWRCDRDAHRGRSASPRRSWTR
ncbi:MAG: hypothetical protein ACRDRZ_12630 [Pseudonocardiaceae bacterium]